MMITHILQLAVWPYQSNEMQKCVVAAYYARSSCARLEVRKKLPFKFPLRKYKFRKKNSLFKHVHGIEKSMMRLDIFVAGCEELILGLFCNWIKSKIQPKTWLWTANPPRYIWISTGHWKFVHFFGVKAHHTFLSGGTPVLLSSKQSRKRHAYRVYFAIKCVR